MARITFEGYGITELRRIAREAGIKGRSTMDGHALLAAMRAYWRAQVVAAEQAVLNVTEVKPGTVLRDKSTGTLVRVTSEPTPYVQDGRNYESLCFEAEYIEVGEAELNGAWAGRGIEQAAHRNEQDARTREHNARGGYGNLGLRHMLYQYEAVSAQLDMDAIHGEALREHDRRRVAAARQGRPEMLNGTLGGPEMILAVLPLAIEQAHADALDEAAERGPAHVRSNCPALPNGGCVRCTAPATVRAAHGDESAYRRPAAQVQ